MLLTYFLLGASDLDEILYILSEDGRVDAENYQFSRVRALFASRACRTAVMIGKLAHNSCTMDDFHDFGVTFFLHIMFLYF